MRPILTRMTSQTMKSIVRPVVGMAPASVYNGRYASLELGQKAEPHELDRHICMVYSAS